MPVITPRDPYIILENSLEAGPEASSYLFRRPKEIIRCDRGEDLAASLAAVDAALGQGFYAAGWVAYEAGYWLEPRLEPLRVIRPPGGTLLWMGIFEAPEVLTPGALEAFWRGRNEGAQDYEVSNIRLALDEREYIKRVQEVKAYLAAGDIYQANFTMPCHFDVSGNLEVLHKAIRQSQRVPYGAAIFSDEESILSYSPELFLQKRGTRLSARPMKGTAARGFTPEADNLIREQLRADEKQRAELLMIVDLLRNDLGRLAKVGSVGVSDAYRVEAYRTVLQMTSTVNSEVPANLRFDDLLRSLFPCGSVTGAPKIRAMEIIAELEVAPRGVYTGAIGFVTPEHDFTFNVPIRTLRIGSDGQGVLGVGSGIVADSDPAAEYRECQLKGSFFTAPRPDFSLIETMRAEDGRIELLDLHMQRLGRSARYFGFSLDVEALRGDIEALLGELRDGECWRLRVLLDRTGNAALTAVPYVTPGEDAPLNVGLADQPLNRNDPMLYHKTTARDAYARAMAKAGEAGLYDLIFTNEDGEVTEGARSNIFAEIDGELLTPPVASGLLSGVYREKLLAEGRAREQVLTVEQLRAADRLFISNALIGLCPATLVR